MTPLLSADRLTVARPGAPAAVDSVSVMVEAGALVCVVGPNGAGKSTLFGALLGEIVPARGTISHGGAISYVPQVIPGGHDVPVSALDVAVMGAYGRTRPFRRVARGDRALAADSLARVGMDEHARCAYSTLSGGQKQRVLVARALVQQGGLFVLDEPLSGVDGPSAEIIMRILDEERRAGAGMLMATHDLALARDRASQVLLLNRRSFGFGPPELVLTEEALLRCYGGHLLAVRDGFLLDDGSHCDHGGSGAGHDHVDRHAHGDGRANGPGPLAPPV